MTSQRHSEGVQVWETRGIGVVYIHRVKGPYSRGGGGGGSRGYRRPPGARGGLQMAPVSQLSTHKSPELSLQSTLTWV